MQLCYMQLYQSMSIEDIEDIEDGKFEDASEYIELTRTSATVAVAIHHAAKAPYNRFWRASTPL